MDNLNAVVGGGGLAMDTPVGANIATRDQFSGSVSTLASAAGYVIPAAWLLGVQVCLHGREFMMGVISGDPMALTSASVLMIAGAMTALALRHHRSTTRLFAELETIKSLITITPYQPPRDDRRQPGAQFQCCFNLRWDRARPIALNN